MRFESLAGHGVYKISYEGIIPSTMRRYNETTSENTKAAYEEYMREVPCSACKGQRLNDNALAVTINDKNIAELSDMSLNASRNFLINLKLSETQHMIADQIIRELDSRLGFLCNVGLDYLSLSRAAATLSGGEAQRIRLATQLGSRLVGVLYILDEPSIGLHQRDNERLLSTLKALRDLGNTLIVVEHDEETLRNADHIVDIGPGAGEHGGEIVAQGSIEDLIKSPLCYRQIFERRKSIQVPKKGARQADSLRL